VRSDVDRRGRVRYARRLVVFALAGLAFAAAFAAWRSGRASGDEVVAKRAGAKAGIHERNHTYRANVGDINGNGLEDLIVLQHSFQLGFPRVYINQGDGTFTNIADTHFPEHAGHADRHDCPIGDVNGNGRADIFCTTGGKKGGTEANASELWLQQEDGNFEYWRDVDDFDLGPAADPWGRSRDAVFLDVNGNGHLDLYIQNKPRQDGRSGVSRLFINEDGERYVRARKHGITGANVLVGGKNLQAIDYDGDGWTDILACGTKGIYLFRNIRGEEMRDVAQRGGNRRTCVWAELADVDGDGRPELIRLNRQALTVHKQRDNGRFGPAIYRRTLRHGEAFATGDVNGNGLADIYVVRQGPTADGAPAGERPGTVDPDRPDAMLINQGDGTDFQRMQIPQLKRGRGDSVTAFDHNQNGLTDFVVMNGHRKARGPVELIAFRRR
jgi:hypothetical protein